MDKKELTIIVVLSVLVLVSLGFNFYQYQNINELTGQVNSLMDEKSQLTGQVNDLNDKVATVDNKIKEFFEFQGEKCENTGESCIDDFLDQFKKVSDVECSPIFDGLCPSWCAAGSDYDCCIKKGYNWVVGKGCYS